MRPPIRKLRLIMHSFRVFLLFFVSAAALAAQPAPPSENSPATPDKTPVELPAFIVSGRLDQARDAIAPSLGASSFLIGPQQLLDLPQGADAPFSQVLLRAPGVAGDSAANGDLHLRGEHANLQYRINDVLLPDGLLGFGQEFNNTVHCPISFWVLSENAKAKRTVYKTFLILYIKSVNRMQ